MLIGITIIVVISLLLILAFLAIYYKTTILLGGRPLRRGPAARGLGKDVVDAFPTFLYSQYSTDDHAALSTGRSNTLECVVCLRPFGGDDVCRRLPGCNHVFHRDCVDKWLSAHVTCPVCRREAAADHGEEKLQSTTCSPGDDRWGGARQS